MTITFMLSGQTGLCCFRKNASHFTPRLWWGSWPGLVSGTLCLAGVVTCDLAHRTDHILHILIAHAVKHRRTEQPLVRVFSDRKLPSLVTEPLSIVRMQMNG